MSLSLALRQSQHLTMTPLLQRSIQLLQLSNQEFHQQVLELIESNPFLETADGSVSAPPHTDHLDIAEAHANSQTSDLHPGPEADHEKPSSDPVEALDAGDATDEMHGPLDDEAPDLGDFGSTGLSGGRAEDETADPWAQVGRPTSLRDHLREQAGCLRLSTRDRLLVESIIDALDGGGYLRGTLEELIAYCPLDPVADEDELRIALRHVQSMDPPGVGARDVSECLILQLRAQAPTQATIGIREDGEVGNGGQDRDAGEQESARQLAMVLVSDHLRALAQHDFQGLQRTLGCSPAQLQAAVRLLRSLVPRPGSAFDSESTQFVVADVVVRKRGHRWIATINPEVIPRVRLHRQHVALMRRSREADPQITECVKEARWLVRNVHQRFLTIQQVAQAIVDHQSRYFEYGDMAMRPLTLAEIAERTGMHESTVSRVTSRKFMATPRGLLEFKHFFGSHVSTAAGTPCSATAVRAVIQTLVEAEDPQAPLSDIRLTRLLEQRGIQVARRTVSKYRDALRIPPVEMRRITGPGISTGTACSPAGQRGRKNQRPTDAQALI
jgi:RNA polymerase sigma-54 factor